ncbi:MAG: glycosyltransferase [Pseudomonadota bacterium]|nr:glycosyltransferase [Pseudomonadota bacterium]
MKILFVITGLGMGGAEHVVSNLADELVKRNHEVKIAYLTGEVLVAPKSSEVEVVPIGVNSAKDFAKAYIKLRSLVKDFKPDVVHSHMFHSNILSRLLRLTANIPKVVNTAHSNNEGGKSRMLAYRLTDRLADISTNVSKDAVESYIAKKATKPNRMIPIPNGIDTNKFSFSSIDRARLRKELNIENEKMILCVGRLDKPKDYPNLFSAIVLLKESRQDFKVFIVGAGPLKKELEGRIEILNIKDYVSFLGMRRDVNDLMSASDVYVMSSEWEGFGLVVAEAMACERLVVATDCGGVGEVVGSNGFLIEPKNSTLLAQELNKALNLDEDERASIGKAARSHIIKNFSLDTNVNYYLNLYEQ